MEKGGPFTKREGDWKNIFHHIQTRPIRFFLLPTDPGTGFLMVPGMCRIVLLNSCQSQSGFKVKISFPQRKAALKQQQFCHKTDAIFTFKEEQKRCTQVAIYPSLLDDCEMLLVV